MSHAMHMCDWQWLNAQIWLVISAVALWNAFTLLCECEKSLIPKSWCIFSFKWGWASRGENRSFPRIMYQPSIWPQHYHSITTCWRNRASYTHARTRPFTCTGLGTHGRIFMFLTRCSLDLDNTQAALCAASSNTRTIQHIVEQVRGLPGLSATSLPVTGVLAEFIYVAELNGAGDVLALMLAVHSVHLVPIMQFIIKIEIEPRSWKRSWERWTMRKISFADLTSSCFCFFFSPFQMGSILEVGAGQNKQDLTLSSWNLWL